MFRYHFGVSSPVLPGVVPPLNLTAAYRSLWYARFGQDSSTSLPKVMALHRRGSISHTGWSFDWNNPSMNYLYHRTFLYPVPYVHKVGIMVNQRIIAGNAQFTGIAAGRGVGFTTGLLLLRKGLGMRETPIRPHSWHCRMQSGYQYGGNRKRPPVWRRHRGSLRPRGRNLGGVEGMTGGCGSGCDPAIHTRRLRVYHRPRRLRMASRISIFFAARRFEPLNSMG